MNPDRWDVICARRKTRTRWPSCAAAVLAGALLTGAGCSTTAPVTTGSLEITASGLPSGLSAIVSVQDSLGFNETATTPHTFDLRAGSYTVNAVTVSQGGTAYSGAPSSQTIVVPASTRPVAASFAYAALPPLAIASAAPPNGTAGVAYGQIVTQKYCFYRFPGVKVCGTRTFFVGFSFKATGGAAPLTWNVYPMPAGLTASGNGQVIGTPSAAGTYILTATVKDSATPQDSVTASYQVVIAP